VNGYRRRVKIDPQPGKVSAWVEDDFHHFGVEIEHDGDTVTRIATHAPRFPWTTCPAAGELLAQRFQGRRLATIAAGEDQRQHCTHQYDIAIAAARHALDDSPTVLDISVADDEGRGALAELSVNGEPTLRWFFANSPREGDPQSGDMAAFLEWTRGLPDALREAGMMFRRGAMVSGGRRLDLERYRTVSEVGSPGACYSLQPERALQSKRVLGAIREFWDSPNALLAETNAQAD
jgi:hypothetical protein